MSIFHRQDPKDQLSRFVYPNYFRASAGLTIGLQSYSDHIAELNSATPKQPFFFLKPASSILIPGAGPVLRPKGVSLHYEVELGLVIGKTIRDLDPNDEKSAFEAIESERQSHHN